MTPWRGARTRTVYRSAPPRPRAVLAAGLAVAALALAWQIATALRGATVYYLTVGEYAAREAAGAAAGDRPVRVSGDVVPGTIARDGGMLKFAIGEAGAPGLQLPVVYRGVVPDIFGEQIQVVVEGRRGAGGAFEADLLLAKCPSKFEAA